MMTRSYAPPLGAVNVAALMLPAVCKPPTSVMVAPAAVNSFFRFVYASRSASGCVGSLVCRKSTFCAAAGLHASAKASKVAQAAARRASAAGRAAGWMKGEPSRRDLLGTIEKFCCF
jgi:hypothetical protein